MEDPVIELSALPFVSLSQKRQLPQRSGVYLATEDHTRIIYIGYATNLRRRWYSHHIIKRLKQDADVQIYFDESLTEIDEEALIRYYKPKLNIKGKYPSRRPIDLNLDDYLLDRIDAFQKNNPDLTTAKKCRILIELGLRYWLPFKDSIIYACPNQRETMDRGSTVSLNRETYDRVFELQRLCNISRTEACRVLICLALTAMSENMASRYI